MAGSPLALDPYTAAITAAIGGGAAIYGGIQAKKERKRIQGILEGESARQRAIRTDLDAQLGPQIQADIEGRETPVQQLAREHEEGLQVERLSRSAVNKKQAILDQLARLGGSTGRSSADIISPAAQARLGRFDVEQSRGLRDLAIQLAAQNARRRETARQSGMSRAQQLAQFRTGGFISPVSDTSGEAIGAAGANLLASGVGSYLSNRNPV